MIEFTAIGPHYKTGERQMVPVRLDRDTNDFAHLKGHVVRINGDLFRVIDVERFMHREPFRKGEPVGLSVYPVKL